MRHIFRLAVAAAVLTVGGCGSGNAGPSYFLTSSSTAVLLVEWGAVSDQMAQGTITYDWLTGTAPSESVKVETVPATVTFSGSSVTLTPLSQYSVLGGQSISGTLSGVTLTLKPPPHASSGLLSAETLTAANSSQYNALVRMLRQQASTDDATAEQQSSQR